MIKREFDGECLENEESMGNDLFFHYHKQFFNFNSMQKFQLNHNSPSFDTKSLVHFFQMVSQFFHIIAIFKRIFIVGWKNLTKNILIISLDLISHPNYFSIHDIQVFFNFIFHAGKPNFLILAF